MTIIIVNYIKIQFEFIKDKLFISDGVGQLQSWDGNLSNNFTKLEPKEKAKAKYQRAMYGQLILNKGEEDKIRKMEKYLKIVQTKYVMALDATDVMLLGYDACDEALNKFVKKTARCVFGAELKQWPNLETGQGLADAKGDAPLDLGTWKAELAKVRELEEVYDWLGSPFKHLCSGTWIGEREYMIDFYSEVMKIIPDGWWDENLFGGDQGFITLVAGRRFPDVILDYKSEIFLSLSGTTEKEVELNLEP